MARRLIVRRTALISIVAVAAAVLLAGCGNKERRAPAGNPTERALANDSAGKGIDRSHRGSPAPEAGFVDAEGKPLTLARYRGKPVLVNLWASWCAPCVKELPTLDTLAARKSIAVAAISQDSGPRASVAAFLTKLKVRNLPPIQDPQMRLSGALGAQVLPTTILYGSDGRELWRYVGDLDWTGPEAAKLLAEAGQKAGGGAH